MYLNLGFKVDKSYAKNYSDAFVQCVKSNLNVSRFT